MIDSHIKHNNHYRIIYKEFRDNDLDVHQQNWQRQQPWQDNYFKGAVQQKHSDYDNLHTDRYKQGKWQPDMAPRGDERQVRMRTEKRIRDLEDDVKKIEAVNKRLKEELKNYKKKVRRSSKGGIRNSNGWTGDEALLADKVTEFSRDYMFPRYKFLKEEWQDSDPMNKKSLSYFVGRKMADTYRSMRIPTIGREFEDQWERVYVLVISLKYQNMRCNLRNNVQAQYFGELHG